MNNDLNLVLKAKVVKLKVELDIKGSKLPTQVNNITKFLSKNPVRLKVTLDATVKELNAQLAIIKSRVASASPARVRVDLDTKGVAGLKGALDNVSRTVGTFNKTYAQQAKQMTASKKKIDQAMKLGNVPTGTAGVQNFNNIKQYNAQLKETQRIMRSKIPQGKDGIFSSVMLKDAQGNLRAFTASMKTADGIIEQVNYKWNAKKGSFTPVSRKTMNDSEAQIRRVQKAIAELTVQREKDFLSTKNASRAGQYEKLINDVRTFKVTLDQAAQSQKKLNQAMKDEQYNRNLTPVGNSAQQSGLRNADLVTVQRFIEAEKRLGVQSLTTTGTIERQGHQVDVLRVKMMGAGKQVQTYTMHFNRATGALHQFGQASTEINANRNLGVFEQLGIAMKRVPVWMAAMTAFYGTINSVRAMGREILLVDKSLTELKRVASDNINIDTIFQGAVGLSKELGNNIHEIMGAVSDLSRTYGQFNERQLIAVARTATLMSNVSDLGVEDATQTLVGTMNAFNIEAEESIRIVDAMNEVDNDFAISTKQLAEGLQKSASTAKTFGVSMEENIGHVAAIGAVTMESGRQIGKQLIAV